MSTNFRRRHHRIAKSPSLLSLCSQAPQQSPPDRSDSLRESLDAFHVSTSDDDSNTNEEHVISAEQRESIESYIQQRIHEKRDLLAETFIEQVETLISERFQQELHTLEQRWLHNPYMDLFLSRYANRPHDSQFFQKPILSSPSLSQHSGSGSTISPSQQPPLFEEVAGEQQYNPTTASAAFSTEYTDLVRQIAYDFRRFFFLEWQRELRECRPQLSRTQRNLMREIADARCDDIEQQLRSLRVRTTASEQALARRVAALEDKLKSTTIPPLPTTAMPSATIQPIDIHKADDDSTDEEDSNIDWNATTILDTLELNELQ